MTMFDKARAALREAIRTNFDFEAQIKPEPDVPVIRCLTGGDVVCSFCSRTEAARVRAIRTATNHIMCYRCLARCIRAALSESPPPDDVHKILKESYEALTEHGPKLGYTYAQDVVRIAELILLRRRS